MSLALPGLTQSNGKGSQKLSLTLTHPVGAILRPLPPPCFWPGLIPQGLPRGRSWNSQKPNPRVTSKRLPGCSPLSSLLTTVISRPHLLQAQRLPELLQGAGAQALPVLQPPSPSTCLAGAKASSPWLASTSHHGSHATPPTSTLPPPPQGSSAPPLWSDPSGFP